MTFWAFQAYISVSIRWRKKFGTLFCVLSFIMLNYMHKLRDFPCLKVLLEIILFFEFSIITLIYGLFCKFDWLQLFLGILFMLACFKTLLSSPVVKIYTRQVHIDWILLLFHFSIFAEHRLSRLRKLQQQIYLTLTFVSYVWRTWLALVSGG